MGTDGVLPIRAHPCNPWSVSPGLTLAASAVCRMMGHDAQTPSVPTSEKFPNPAGISIDGYR